jgi:hypothetical protein
MLITGQPQYVRLLASDAAVAHAVVAYAATPTGLWIADPNFPGKLRDIEWDQKARAFKPYDSGPTAATSDVHFDTIAFLGKTAMIDWDKIGERWAEVDSGSIGTGPFPLPVLSIQITNPDGTQTWSPMRDGPIDTTRPTLELAGDDYAPPLRATLYDGTRKIGALTDQESAEVTLPNGISDLGVYIEAKDAKYGWRAVDFYHFALTAPPPSSVAPSTPASAEPSPSPAPPTAGPTPAPAPTYDCSKVPTTPLEQMQWDLNCQGISPAPTR